MIVEELVAVLGAKINEGEFADAFALFDHLERGITTVLRTIEQGVEAAFNAVHEVAMQGDEIAATAEKYGIAATALQELGYAATLSDTSAEALTNGLKFLGKAAAEAGKGGEAGAAALKDFGSVAIKENGKIRPVEDLLMDLADSFQAMPDGVEKSNRALQLFGRAGLELVPLMNKGSGAIGELRAEAQRLGIVMDGSALAASSAYDDAFKRLNATIQGLQKGFAKTAIIERVTVLFTKLQAALSTPGARRAIEALSNGFDRMLVMLGGLVDGLTWVLQHEGAIDAALIVVAGGLTAIAIAAAQAGAAMIASAASAAAAWLAAAAPLLLLGGAIFLIFEDILTYIEGGDSMLGRLIATLGSINPDDSPILVLFKSLGALLFDLGSPEKWRRVFDALTKFNMQLVTGAYDFFKVITNGISTAIQKLINDLYTGIRNVFETYHLGGLFDMAAAPVVGGATELLNTDITGKYLDYQGEQVNAFFAKEKGLADLFGFGSAPGTSAAASDNSRRSVSINAPVVVNASTNADPNEIASHVQRSINQALTTQAQEAGALFSQ